MTFLTAFQTLKTIKKTFFISGDITINISTSDRSAVANQYINILTSCSTVPIITKLTRVTKTIATVLDHVITNDNKHELVPGIFESSNLSDHYIIFCQINDLSSAKKESPTVNYYRDKSKFNSQLYNSNLQQAQNDLGPNNFSSKSTLSNYTSEILYCDAKIILLRYSNSTLT